MATQYQKRMMVRRTSDLTRLAEQYKQNIEAMTGQYETEFANYQKQRDELMAPYEAAVKKYKEVDMPNYESAAAAYRQRLEAFNQRLSAYESDTGGQELVLPGDKNVRLDQRGNLASATVIINGRAYFPHELPEGYSVKRVPGGKSGMTYEVYKPKERGPVPTFNESAPKAPAAPQAPEIAGFDSAKFEQAKVQLQTDYQRETGERKDARLAAVGRKASRPLLQGA